MKIVLIAATIVLFASFPPPVSPQDSSSVEQCRVDLASWTHDFSYTDNTRAESLLTYDKLKDRTAEASKCGVLDDKEPYHTAAAVLQIRYNGLMKDRVFDFLVRHDLTSQFQKEDTNGLR
jgi:hypothetical protein